MYNGYAKFVTSPAQWNLILFLTWTTAVMFVGRAHTKATMLYEVFCVDSSTIWRESRWICMSVALPLYENFDLH